MRGRNDFMPHAKLSATKNKQFIAIATFNKKDTLTRFYTKSDGFLGNECNFSAIFLWIFYKFIFNLFKICDILTITILIYYFLSTL